MEAAAGPVDDLVLEVTQCHLCYAHLVKGPSSFIKMATSPVWSKCHGALSGYHLRRSRLPA